MQKEFTRQARKVVNTARTLAKKFKHPYVGTEHLLLGLKKEITGVAGQILAMNQVDEDKIIRIIDELVSPTDEVCTQTSIEFSPRLEYLLELSYREALHFGSEIIGTEHMLLAILKDIDCVAGRILVTLNVNLLKMQEDILETLGMNPKEYLEDSREEGRGQGNILAQYTTDLTTQAEEGKLDPVVGREEEIERLMQVLSRRTKNNPCLVGEPGVGKTAIIEGLASRIAAGIVPEGMRNKRLVTMDLSGMIAGSKYRGEFEDRMKKMIREVKADGNIILFLDEVHTMIGAGGAEGAIDAANILKPSLARGELQLIGATTIVEYRKHIEKDAALERRFQPITVEEPTQEHCERILEGLKPKYEAHHHVKIEEDALKAAVQMSARYINDRHLPDKAIDVLDEACSKVSLAGFKVPDSLEKLETALMEMAMEKEERIKAGDFAEASLIHQEQQEAEKKLESVKKRFRANQAKRVLAVTEDDVAEVVSA